MRSIVLAIALLTVAHARASAQGELQFAELGECPLQNGQVILDCKIGYRTWGTLNADRSNAVLFPSWFRGTTDDLARYVGPDGFVDPSRLFVVAVDAFGNGVSSSPSNSTQQPGDSFPRFTVRDMVDAQHRLLVEELGIEHLWAVMGISMGGMQTFEWLVAYPTFLEKAVSIVGSPQLTSYDLMFWRTQLEVIEQCRAAGCENTGALLSLIGLLVRDTPQYRNQQTARGNVDALIERVKQLSQTSYRLDDYASALRAVMAHDVAAAFGGDLDRAAETVRADLLTVVATFDHGVTPEAARDFTGRVGGALLELDSLCGHNTTSCEADIIGFSTKGFLARGR